MCSECLEYSLRELPVRFQRPLLGTGPRVPASSRTPALDLEVTGISCPRPFSYPSSLIFPFGDIENSRTKQKPPIHQGRAVIAEEISVQWNLFHRTSTAKSLRDQGTLRLHRRLPDLLSEVVPDVASEDIQPASRCKEKFVFGGYLPPV